MSGLERIQELVQEASGIASETLGRNTVERAVRRRMAERNIQSAEEYQKELEESAVERQTLIEALVVPETWFFRHAEAFGVLVKHALDLARLSRVLRVLSIPCSTGEEPYSIAMALLDAGLTRASFLIDAVDISAKEIAWAKRAVYGRNSFRGNDQAFRDRYFLQTNINYQLRADVYGCVQFERANLLAAQFSRTREKYDVIFCRNLLIYFDSETQVRAIQTLSRLLVDDGVLLSGPSESPLFLQNGFESAQVPRAFAFRHLRPVKMLQQRKAMPRITTPSRPTLATPQPLRVVERQIAAAVAVPPERVPAESALEKAERLADGGSLAEAGQLCELYIREHGVSARAFYLLGLVKDAASDSQGARECYRKAVYLQPDHYPSLVQLSLIAEQDGNLTSARAFRDRALRVSARGSATNNRSGAG